MSAPIVIRRVPKQLSTGQRSGGVWPWPDQAHITFQDVEQLRQFIKACDTQKTSKFRNPVVVLLGAGNAELITEILGNLVQSGGLRIPRGGYFVTRGRGRVIVTRAKN